jgi:hypothetical protein
MRGTLLASKDVFNPYIGYQQVLGFNPNWNYQSPVTGGANDQIARPRFGAWSSREVGDAGYAFDLTFVDRPIEQVNYIRNWYSQFKRGFFTIIDWDNKKREHVGRFTAPPKVTPTANLRYNVTVTFEEIPACPMRNYPANWEEWSHWLQVADDWLNPEVNFSSSVANAWALQQSPLAIAEGVPSSVPRGMELFNETPASDDFAQMEYAGWGFRMNFRLGTALGQCALYIDGVAILTIDLYNGDGGLFSGAPLAPVWTFVNGSLVVMETSMPLGRHRVKVVALGTKNASSTGTSVLFPAMQVIY